MSQSHVWDVMGTLLRQLWRLCLLCFNCTWSRLVGASHLQEDGIVDPGGTHELLHTEDDGSTVELVGSPPSPVTAKTPCEEEQRLMRGSGSRSVDEHSDDGAIIRGDATSPQSLVDESSHQTSGGGDHYDTRQPNRDDPPCHSVDNHQQRPMLNTMGTTHYDDDLVSMLESPSPSRAQHANESHPPDEDSDDEDPLCHICFDRVETHEAVPCGHRACGICFQRWLESHPLCMLCAKPIESVERLEVHHTALQPYEIMRVPTFSSPAGVQVAVNQAIFATIHAFLTLKDRLLEVDTDLGNVQKHLLQLARSNQTEVDANGRLRSRGGVSFGEASSVVRVEQLAITESLTKLAAYAGIRRQSGVNQGPALWNQVHGKLVKITEALHSAQGFIKSHLDDEASMKVFRGILEEIDEQKPVQTQWLAVKTCYESSINEKLKGIFKMLGFLQMSAGVAIPDGAQMMQDFTSLQQTVPQLMDEVALQVVMMATELDAISELVNKKS